MTLADPSLRTQKLYIKHLEQYVKAGTLTKHRQTLFTSPSLQNERERATQHTSMIHEPSCVEHVVHRHHVLLFADCTGAHTAQLLHVSANAEEQAQVHAVSSNVCSSLSTDHRAFRSLIRELPIKMEMSSPSC